MRQVEPTPSPLRGEGRGGGLRPHQAGVAPSPAPLPTSDPRLAGVESPRLSTDRAGGTIDPSGAGRSPEGGGFT
jgi:hypothetical protein